MSRRGFGVRRRHVRPADSRGAVPAVREMAEDVAQRAEERLRLNAEAAAAGVTADPKTWPFRDPCEWNPAKNRAAYAHECHAAATTIVGANGKLRTCDACAALPQFARYKKSPILRPLKEPRT